METETKKPNYVAVGFICMLSGLGIEHIADRVGAFYPHTIKVESTAVTLIDPAQAATIESSPLPKARH
jgi:hypothetical protein